MPEIVSNESDSPISPLRYATVWCAAAERDAAPSAAAAGKLRVFLSAALVSAFQLKQGARVKLKLASKDEYNIQTGIFLKTK